MGSKNEPGDFDCYHNALPDEPMFILLARDPSSPERVEDWATERQRLIDKGFKPKSDQAMVDEAIRCAANMRRWRVVNNGAWRSPSPIPEAPGGREEIIEECAEIARSMKMAAAYANVYGRLSEAYGAVEVSILALKPQDGGSTVANEDISTNPAPRLHAFQAAGRREHEQPMPHRSADIVTALDAIEAQLHEMRSLKGWRLNLIRENLAKAKAAVGVAQGYAKPAAWMSREHVEAYMAGNPPGIAWASPEQTEFYDTALYTAPAQASPIAHGHALDELDEYRDEAIELIPQETTP